jgi:hypothetical protein
VEADYSIELGPDDATLDFPWAAPQPGPMFIDLRAKPSSIIEISEAVKFPELAEFLAALNASASILQSAKCDVWFTTEITPEDEIFGMGGKFGGYVDLVFTDDKKFSFAGHEHFAQRIVDLLKRAPDIPCSVELLVRRSYFAEREGFYITAYCFGFGATEAAARRQWSIALKLLENAFRQAGSRS